MTSDFDRISDKVKSRRYARDLITSPRARGGGTYTDPWWDGVSMIWGRADMEAFHRLRLAHKAERAPK